MARSLVIVESPAKAKTINKYLGRNYSVKASYGHVMDLPKKEFGIDIEHEFEPTYETIPGKHKVISELKKAAKELGATVKTSDYVLADGQVPDIGSMAGGASVARTATAAGAGGDAATGAGGAGACKERTWRMAFHRSPVGICAAYEGIFFWPKVRM